jgi:CelD/BcsL family acetyltransferase involved in cellulose biosynthesis
MLRPAVGSPSAFAFAEVFDTIEAARGPWAEIGKIAPASPYQHFEFVRLWLETVGVVRRVTPMIVVARDEAGDITALLPLGALSYGWLRFAAFLGGKDANYNMGLFRPGIAWSSEEIKALLATAARLVAPHIDTFLFVTQPRDWQGTPNPMAAMPGQPNLGFAYKSVLPDDFTAWRDAHASREAQKKLRKKTKRLEAVGPLAHRRAADPGEIERVLAAFHAQKSARMRSLGIANAYEGAEGREFLRRLALSGVAEGAPLLELHALFVGDRIVATFGALGARDRLSGLFLSFDGDPEIARSSPGELIVHAVVRDAIARGFNTFDLGAGDARYKDEACETKEELFDNACAITPLGHVAAPAFMAKQRVKRRIKGSPRLLALFTRLEPKVRN